MATYKLGKYTFNTQAEYEKAKQELSFIQQARAKYNVNDPRVAQKILEKFRPQTAVGKDFCNQLRGICGAPSKSPAVDRRSASPSRSTAPSRQNMVMYDPEKIEILRRLKKYDHTYESMCYECGYKGPMGVIKDGSKIKKVLAFIIVFIIFMIIPSRYSRGIGGMILIAFWFLYIKSKLKANQMILYCPNCEHTQTENPYI